MPGTPPRRYRWGRGKRHRIQHAWARSTWGADKELVPLCNQVWSQPLSHINTDSDAGRCERCAAIAKRWEVA